MKVGKAIRMLYRAASQAHRVAVGRSRIKAREWNALKRASLSVSAITRALVAAFRFQVPAGPLMTQ